MAAWRRFTTMITVKSVIPFAGLGAVVLIGVSCCFPQQPTVRPQIQVAELLDSIIQPRFQTDMRVFGMNRVIKLVDGHGRVDSSAGFDFARMLQSSSPDD